MFKISIYLFVLFGLIADGRLQDATGYENQFFSKCFVSLFRLVYFDTSDMIFLKIYLLVINIDKRWMPCVYGMREDG